jgi:hypothetical protein
LRLSHTVIDSPRAIARARLVLKISGKCSASFRAPNGTRFLGCLGGRASGPISCRGNDMPSEHGRLEGTPRVRESGTKSTRALAEELCSQGHPVSHQTVAAPLADWGYSRQAKRKAKEGLDHPDRDAQFEHINRRVREFQRGCQPVVSVDAKKELVGDFRNPGREWRPHGRSEEVRAKDFKGKRLGKAIPEGVYDLSRNEGWVSVGVDHDTAEFAVESLRRWWQEMGSSAYLRARRLLITADAGVSNGYRARLWKVELQGLADETGPRISFCHFPPVTSKWNKIEHRIFCHITQKWLGRPLRSRAIVVNLIGHTTTRAGLQIQAELDPRDYLRGVKVSDEELAAINLEKDTFHGEWNYALAPCG